MGNILTTTDEKLAAPEAAAAPEPEAAAAEPEAAAPAPAPEPEAAAAINTPPKPLKPLQVKLNIPTWNLKPSSEQESLILATLAPAQKLQLALQNLALTKCLLINLNLKEKELIEKIACEVLRKMKPNNLLFLSSCSVTKYSELPTNLFKSIIDSEKLPEVFRASSENFKSGQEGICSSFLTKELVLVSQKRTENLTPF